MCYSRVQCLCPRDLRAQRKTTNANHLGMTSDRGWWFLARRTLGRSSVTRRPSYTGSHKVTRSVNPVWGSVPPRLPSLRIFLRWITLNSVSAGSSFVTGKVDQTLFFWPSFGVDTFSTPTSDLYPVKQPQPPFFSTPDKMYRCVGRMSSFYPLDRVNPLDQFVFPLSSPTFRPPEVWYTSCNTASWPVIHIALVVWSDSG